MPLLGASALAADKPPREFKPFKFSVAQISTQGSEVANSQAELQRDSLLLNAAVNIPLNRQWSVGLSLGYDSLDYAWHNVNGMGANAVSALFGSNGERWEQIERYRGSVSLNYRLDQHWRIMIAPQLQYAYADTASSSNAQSYGVVASAMYAFESGNMLGLGVAYLNDIDEVRTVPYLAMRWQINERLSLANPFKAGFSGPAGLELSYQLHPHWNIGLGNAKRTERFLIKDEDIAVELNEWVTYLRGGWQATASLAVNLYAGYYFNGELEVTRQPGVDMDNQGAAALDLEFKF
ncbi:MAG: DUF6268 family outer membrane beta-barrel protein [Shewanella sp.]